MIHQEFNRQLHILDFSSELSRLAPRLSSQTPQIVIRAQPRNVITLQPNSKRPSTHK